MRQAIEKYYARLAGAIRYSLDERDARRFEKIMRALAKTGVRQLLKRQALTGSDNVDEWTNIIYWCILAMDDPYRLSQEPWRSIGFTDEQRRTLESTITVRYLTGGHEVFMEEQDSLDSGWTPQMLLKYREMDLIKRMKIEMKDIPRHYRLNIVVDDRRKLQSIQVVPLKPGEENVPEPGKIIF